MAEINPLTGLPFGTKAPLLEKNIAPLFKEQIALPSEQVNITSEPASSFTDYDVTLSRGNDIEEARAQRQPTWEKWTNATAKMGILAGTTFADGTIGSIAGVGNTITGGENNQIEASDFWNNPISNKLASIGEESEKWFPNYQTHKEQDNPWYKNMGTANFWADTIFKNFGFAIGALGAGALTGAAMEGALGSKALARSIGHTLGKNPEEALKLIEKGALSATQLTEELKKDAALLKKYDLISQFAGATGAAVGEARIEAINNSSEYYNKLLAQGVDPAKADEMRKEMGNIDFGINVPLLAMDNFWQFRKVFGGNFEAERTFLNNISGSVTSGFKNEGLTTAEKAWKLAKNPIREGNEEMSQEFASQFGQDFTNRRYDKEATSAVNDVIASTISGLAKSYGDVDQWVQGFAGAITGAIGLPNFAKMASKEALKDGKTSWIAGGMLNDYRELKDSKERTDKVVSALNEIATNEDFANSYYSKVTDTSLEMEKQRALHQNRPFDYKNAEAEQFINNVATYVDAGKFEELVNFWKDTKNLSATEVRDALKVKEGKEIVDLYSDKTDEELLQIHHERADKMIKKAEEIRDLREQIKIKSANRVDPQIERHLLHYAASIKDVEERATKLTTEVNDKLNNITVNVDGEDNPNLTEEDLVLGGLNIADTLENIQDKKVQQKLLERAHLYASQNAKSVEDVIKGNNEIVEKVNDLIALSNRRKKFIEYYKEAFSDPAKFKAKLIAEQEKFVANIKAQIIDKKVAIGKKFTDKDGVEWIVRPNTTNDKFSLVKKMEDGTEITHHEMSNVTKEELFNYLNDNNFEHTGFDEDIAKEVDARQITEDKVAALKKKIDSFKNAKALAKFWKDEVKPLNLANSVGIHAYIRERYFKLTGKVINAPEESKETSDVDVEQLKDLEKMISNALSLNEIASIMNDIVYPLYGQDGEFGKKFREQGVAKWNELKAIKTKQLEVLTNVVEDRYNTLNKVLDSTKELETKLSKLQEDLEAAIILNNEAQSKSNRGRNAKINEANKKIAEELLVEAGTALSQTQSELNKKKDLIKLLEDEINFFEKKIKSIKDDSKILKLNNQLTADKQELQDKKESEHRFTIDRLNTHLHYTNEEIKVLEENIERLKDYIHVLEHSIIPVMDLFLTLDTQDRSLIESKLTSQITVETDPLRRATLMKQLSNYQKGNENNQSFIHSELIRSRKKLKDITQKLEVERSKKNRLADSIVSKERIAELEKDIPIFERFLNGDPNDRKNNPGIKAELAIAKKEQAKVLIAVNPNSSEITLVPETIYTSDADNNAEVSSKTKEEYDKGNVLFESAKRSAEMLRSGLVNNQEKTDEDGKRYYEFLNNVPIDGHQLRVVLQSPTDDKLKQIEIENSVKYKNYGEAGLTIVGIVVNYKNQPVDKNGEVIDEKDIPTKGVFSPFPLNITGEYGARSYSSKEQTEESQKILLNYRKDLVAKIRAGETPLVGVVGKSMGIPQEIPNANVAFNEDKGLTPLNALGETTDLNNYDIEVSTAKTEQGKSFIFIGEHNMPTKAGYIYAIDKKTGNVYNVKTRKVNDEETESIVNLFKGFANSLVLTKDEETGLDIINMKNGSNALASHIPGAPEEFNTIFKVLESMVFWTQTNINKTTKKPINTNPKTLFHWLPNSKVIGGEIVVGTDASGKVLSYPLVTVVGGIVRFNSQLEQRLREFLPQQHLNVSSANLKGEKKDNKFYSIESVTLDTNGKISKAPFKEHTNYKSYIASKLFSPIVPRTMVSAGSTQFVNKYLIYDNAGMNINDAPASTSTTTTTPTDLEAKKADIERRRQEVERIKKLPFQQRLAELKRAGIVTDVYRYGNRPIVVVNINGKKQPFYRSSSGTGGKTKAKWFPMFGFGRFDNKATDYNWLIKASTKDNEVNLNSKAFAEYSNIINSTLNWEHGLDLNMQNPFLNPEITFTGDENGFNNLIYGKNPTATLQGTEGNEYAYDWIDKNVGEINAKYDAELKALEGATTTTPTTSTVTSTGYKSLPDGIVNVKLNIPGKGIIDFKVLKQGTTFSEEPNTTGTPTQLFKILNDGNSVEEVNAGLASRNAPQRIESITSDNVVTPVVTPVTTPSTKVGAESTGSLVDELTSNNLTGQEAWDKYGQDLPDDIRQGMSQGEKKNYALIRRANTHRGEDLPRATDLNSFEGFENIDEAKKWFKEKFPKVDFNVVKSLIDGKSYGQFKGAAVYIYENAEVGTTYHEAFHVVSQLFLTKKERQALYNEVRNRTGYSKLTDIAAEEILAEEFRDFMLGKSIPKTESRKKNFFERLLSFIKDFIFGKPASIQEVFDRAKNGYYSNKQFVTPYYKGKLNRSKYIGGDETKSETFQQDVMDSVSYFFFDKLYSNQDNINKLFKGEVLDEGIIDTLYNYAKSKIKAELQYWEDEYAIENDESALGFINDFKFILNNFDNDSTVSVRAIHIEHLKKYNVELVTTDDFNDNPDKGRDSTQLWSAESLKMSSLMNASKNIKMLIASLPQKQIVKNKNVESEWNSIPFIYNSIGLPATVDFDKTFSALINKLSNTSSIQEQDELLREIQSEIPGIVKLRSRLGLLGNNSFLNNTSVLNFDKLLQLLQFTQAFGKQRNEFRMTMIDENGQYKIVDGNAISIKKRILETWKNSVNKSIMKTVGKDLVINTKLDVPTNLINALTQLKQLGIKFTRLDYNQGNDKLLIQFRDLLKSYEDAVPGNVYTAQEFLTKTAQLFITLNKSENVNIYDPNNEGAGFKGDLEYLMGLEEVSSIDNIENSTFNISGERIYLNTLNNYLSNFINDVNKAKTIDDLYVKHPHLASAYTANSLWFKKLFNEDGMKIPNAKIALNISLGVKEMNTSDKGDEFDNLKSPDMWMLWLNETLKGNYSFLRASDNKLERFFDIGEIVSENDLNNNVHIDHLIDYIKAEAGYIHSNEWKGWDKINGLDSKFEGGKKKAGIVLDIIKDRLPSVYKQLGNPATFTQVIDINREPITKVLNEFITERSKKILDELTLNKVVVKTKNGYGSFGIDNKGKEVSQIIMDGSAKAGTLYTDEAMVNLVKRAFVNDFISNIEQTKLMIGHPLFYKDVDNFFKRMSGAVGTKKLINVDEATNKAINENLVRQDKKITAANKDAIVKTMILADVEVYADHYDNYFNNYVELFKEQGLSEKEAKEKATIILDPYTKMNEADAQGYISMDEFREMLFRTGDWTRDLEKWYQWETQGGWEGKSVKMPDSVFYADLAGKTIHKSDFGKVVGNPQKPQYFGPLAENGFIPGFYKLSVMPLIPSLTAGKKIDELRKHMMANQIGIVVFESGNKVGTKLNDKGEKNKIYNEDGKLNLNDPSIVTQDTFYKHWGIQLDVAPKTKHEVVKGTQMAKQIINALYENGTPKAIRFVKNGILQEADKNATSARVNELINLTAKRIEIGTKELINKLGLKNNLGEYEIESLDSLINKLVDEAISRDMPENIVDSIRLLSKDFGVEGVANAEKIENILMAMADSMTVSRKVHGAPKIQGAATLFESFNANDELGRKFVIQNKKTGNKEVVQSIKGLDTKEYNTMLTSSDLKFYENNNGIVTSMEVYLPHYFKEVTGKLDITDNKIDARLLENLIGFRIPTQGMNNIESIKIKGFLPSSAGDLIVMPTSIVAKSGSDYDIDKLNVFFPNYYIDEETKAIKYLEYTTDEDILWKRNKRSLANKNPDLKLELKEINNRFKEELNSIQKGYSISEGIFKSKEDSTNSILSEYNEKVKTYKNYIKEEANSYYLIGLLSEYNREPSDDLAKEIEAEIGMRISDIDLEELQRQKTVENRTVTADRKALWRVLENEIDNSKEVREKFQKSLKTFETYRKNSKERVLTLIKEKESSKENVYNKTKPLFNSMSIEEKNGIKAIDNRILELYKDFILSPDNFFQLTVPNSADKLKEISRKANYLENKKENETFEQYKERFNNEKKTASLYNMADRNFIMEVTNRNLVGKALVGVGALQSTNNVLAQLYDMYITPTVKVDEEDIDTNINLKGVNIDGKGNLILSALNNHSGEEIWELLSEFISSAVDAAKDPFIIDLNVTTNTANTFLLLLRAGVPLEEAGMFMVQPIIKQYVLNQNIYESHLAEVNDYKLFKNQIVKKTLSQFNNAKATQGLVFDSNELEEMISKKSGHPDYYAKQAQILSDFLRYQEVAKKLSESIKATTYDTSSPKNVGELMYKLRFTELIRDNGEIGNFWKMFNDNGFFEGAYKANKEFLDVFKPMFTTLKDERLKTLLNDYINIFLENPVGQDDRNSAVAKFKANILTAIITTNKITINGEKNNALMLEKERLFQGANSLPNRIKKLQDSKNKVSNLLIDELLPIFAGDIDNLKMYGTRFDKLASDSITNEWRKLFDSNPELAKDLVKFILIQSGIENSPINFINFIPAKIYGEVVQSALEQQLSKNGNFNTIYTDFFQQAGNNDKIVPIYKEGREVSASLPLMKEKLRNPKFDKNNPQKGVSFFLPEVKLRLNPNYKLGDKYKFDTDINGYVQLKGKSDLRNGSTIKEFGDTPSIVRETLQTLPQDIVMTLVEQPIQNKEGIDFVFEQSPELANDVYETLGFKINITQDNKSYYRGQIEQPTIDKDGNLILYGREDELYKRANLKSKGVSMTDDLQSAVEYGIGQLEVAKNLASETYDRDIELERLSENGYYLIQIPKNISNEIVKEAGEVKVVGDKIIIPKGQYKIEQIIEDADTQITPQQKQQAQQLYSSYLDTIFPYSKVKDIVYHGTNRIFDKFLAPNRRFSDWSTELQKMVSEDSKGAIYFTNRLDLAQNSGKNIKASRVVSSLLNIKNPKETTTQIGIDDSIPKLKKEGFDSYLFTNNKANYIVQAVFEPEQIHILGSKQDIENFKKFVEQPINKEIKEELFDSSLPKVNIWAGSKENTILSNLAVRPFTFQGDEFKSVEEYFQLQKANYLKEELYKDGNEAELEKVVKHNQKISDEIVKNENNPFQIKQLGRKFIGLDTKAWDKAALDEMKKVLKPSFEQNPEALKALLDTGKAQLTHTQDTGRWKTDFPQALMEVRQELTQKQPIVEETKKGIPYKILSVHLWTQGDNFTIRVENPKTKEKGSFSVSNSGRWIIAKFNPQTKDYEIVANPLTQATIINNAKLALGEELVYKIIEAQKIANSQKETDKGEKLNKWLELTGEIKKSLENSNFGESQGSLGFDNLWDDNVNALLAKFPTLTKEIFENMPLEEQERTIKCL